MIWELKMPRLDEDMFEGTVTGWLKKEGDSVQKGEPVVEIETQKVNFEVEAPGSGVLRIILAQEGDLLPINSVMGVIAELEEDIRSYQRLLEERKAPALISEAEPTIPRTAPADSFPGSGRIPISPVAKKLALEKGVDITKIRGTGPGGRITKEDVLNFPPEEPKTSSRAKSRIRQVLPISGMRKTIADRLAASWKGSPRAEHFMTVDVTGFIKMREENGEFWDQEHGIKPSMNDVVIAAAGRALRAFPAVNASLQNGRIEIYEDVNISIAVALEKGLITPVIRRADARSIFDIAGEAQRLTELVRRGEHSRDTLSGSTFTVTNLGMFDVDFFVPIINPPESAILSVGKVEKKPLVIDDAIAIRSVMCLCLAFDHRLLDGAIAARFLKHIKQTLENPRVLFLEEG